MLDHALGLGLALLVLASVKHEKSILRAVSERSLKAFNDCAVFLAFAIQIAAIVVLVREDFGISTAGMGDGTVRITQSISMLTLLPLLYILAVLPLERSSEKDSGDGSDSSDSHIDAENGGAHSVKRLSLFLLCWALAFYPFYSTVGNAFSPSKIRKGAPIDRHRLAIIEGICFENVHVPTAAEYNLTTAFVMLAYLPLSVGVVGCVLCIGIERNHPGSAAQRRLKSFRKRFHNRVPPRMILAVLAMLSSLASGLLWSVFRIRQFQQQLVFAIGGSDADGNWTFGQVVAVTVFVPVLVEGWSSFSETRSPESNNVAPVSREEHGDKPESTKSPK